MSRHLMKSDNYLQINRWHNKWDLPHNTFLSIQMEDDVKRAKEQVSLL